jgi:hypothetical protein
LLDLHYLRPLALTSRVSCGAPRIFQFFAPNRTAIVQLQARSVAPVATNGGACQRMWGITSLANSSRLRLFFSAAIPGNSISTICVMRVPFL